METDRSSDPAPQGLACTARNQIVSIARSWIGTPYVHQASVKGAGCDCLGLLRGVWRELYGAEPEAPPAYAPDWAEAAGRETLHAALARHLTEVATSALSPGDIALFRMIPGGPAKHCGIVGTGEGGLTLIHARQNRRVAEEPITKFWSARLAFAFRLRAPMVHSGDLRGSTRCA